MKNRVVHGATRESILEYAQNNYNSNPEYLWMKYPNYAVLRRFDNKKWYAIIMDIERNKLGLQGEDRIDILDIKCSPEMKDMLLGQNGFLPAYHLNRDSWITILLDGSVDCDIVCHLLDGSFELALGKHNKVHRFEPTSWLVPVNPKYYDIQKAFDESDTILWKQSSSVIVGDTIYLYITAPFSCVLYKCVAVDVDIPYKYDDGKVRMNNVMKIKLLHTYDKDMFTLAKLQEHGIVSVRGPRSIPYSLLYKLEMEADEDR